MEVIGIVLVIVCAVCGVVACTYKTTKTENEIEYNTKDIGGRKSARVCVPHSSRRTRHTRK